MVFDPNKQPVDTPTAPPVLYVTMTTWLIAYYCLISDNVFLCSGVTAPWPFAAKYPIYQQPGVIGGQPWYAAQIGTRPGPNWWRVELIYVPLVTSVYHWELTINHNLSGDFPSSGTGENSTYLGPHSTNPVAIYDAIKTDETPSFCDDPHTISITLT